MSFELFCSHMNLVVDMLYFHYNSTVYKCFQVSPKVPQNFAIDIYTSGLLYQKTKILFFRLASNTIRK